MVNSEKADLIYVRGWYYVEGVAVVRVAQPSNIEVLPGEQFRNVHCHGFFHNFQGQIKTAVFVLNGRLFFQLEQKRWDWMDDHVRIKHKKHAWGKLKNSVSVYAAGEQILRLVYPSPIEEFIKLGDMSFDVLDEEMKDWWLWLSNIVANSKKREPLLRRWQAGI
jgi:hypothetical protein